MNGWYCTKHHCFVGDKYERYCSRQNRKQGCVNLIRKEVKGSVNAHQSHKKHRRHTVRFNRAAAIAERKRFKANRQHIY